MNTYLTTRKAPYLLFPHRWLTQNLLIRLFTVAWHWVTLGDIR